MELTAFLAARLDEDEAEAKTALAVAPAPWSELGEHWIVDNAGNGFAVADFTSHRPAMPHIARHDPARVLREVEAKRAILALHPAEPMRHIEADRCPACSLTWPCAHVRAIAAVYSDHPDYQPEWKP